MQNASDTTMDADDMDDLDCAIFDVLLEGHDEGEPWGVATPNVMREMLLERDLDVDIPSRQAINDRMRRLQIAGHLLNRHDQGEYEFATDPRE